MNGGVARKFQKSLCYHQQCHRGSVVLCKLTNILPNGHLHTICANAVSFELLRI
jgi:hypothetical protein